MSRMNLARPFHARKVKSHQSQATTSFETHKDRKLRIMNEAADQRAVQGAGQANDLAAKRKHYAAMSLDVQRMLISVVQARAALANQKWGHPGQKCRHELLQRDLLAAEVELAPQQRLATIHSAQHIQNDEGEEEVFDFGQDTLPPEDREHNVEEPQPSSSSRGHEPISESSNGISLARRDEVYPGHWWEPRRNAEAQPPLQGKSLSETVFAKRDWIWNTSLIEPLFWYWSTTWIDTEAVIDAENEHHDRPADKQTMWVIILFDFIFATAEVPARVGVDGATTLISTQVRAFTAARHNMFDRFQVDRLEVLKDTTQLSTLALPAGIAVPGRLRCLRPEAVNAALFDIANRQALNTLQCKAWTFHYSLSADVRPVWGGDLRKEDTSKVRRRIRGKSKRPPAYGTSLVKHAKERPRVRPLHNTALAAATFTEAEQQALDALPRYHKLREQKRLLHNQEAANNAHLHLFDAFTSFETTKLRCQRCTNWIELRIKCGSSYLDWRAARNECPRESTEGIDTNRRNVAKIVKQRNQKIREHNLRWWGSDETHHVFYEVAPNAFETLACRRHGCQHGRKPFTSGKWLFSRTKCQGQKLENEMRTAYSPGLLSSENVADVA